MAINVFSHTHTRGKNGKKSCKCIAHSIHINNNKLIGKNKLAFMLRMSDPDVVHSNRRGNPAIDSYELFVCVLF